MYIQSLLEVDCSNRTFRTLVTATFLIFLPSIGSFSQDSISQSVIESNLFRIASRPSNLDSIFEKFKYFFLGEATHGDGLTLKAKNNLIKYLVENHGFQVILLERAFYELSKVNMLIKNASSRTSASLINEALRNEDFISSGYLELGNYIVSNKKNLEVGGIDVAIGTQIIDFLYQDLENAGIKKVHVKLYKKQLMVIINLGLCFDCNEAFDIASFGRISSSLVRELLKINNKASSLLVQVIKNNLSLAEWIEKRPQRTEVKDRIDFRKVHELRDKFMAHNLIWYINSKYPDKKIIISTSTLHMSPNVGEEPMTMVDYLPDSIKKKSYFLPFITYKGTRGFETHNKLREITNVKIDSTSFEQTLHSIDIKEGIVDFSNLNYSQKEFLNSITMHPSGLLTSKCKWGKVYSGVYFIDTMKPDIWKPLKSQNIHQILKSK